MFLSDLSIKRPVLMSMVLIVFLLFGTLAYFKLNLDLVPETNLPMITVQTVYPGAGPQDIELQVTKKIEAAVSPISKILEIRSYSMEAVSLVLIRFDLNKNVNIARQEVREKIDAILNELPTDCQPPIIQTFDINAMPIIDIVLTGDLALTNLYEIAEKKLKDRLAQVEGVAYVDVSGGEQREIRIELDNRLVFQNSISLPQLANILQAQNLDMPGGHFQQRSQEYSVRVSGEFENLGTLENLEIPTLYGNKRMRDLANIQDRSAEVRERTSFIDNSLKQRRDNVVLLSLIKTSDGNTVQIARTVKKILPEIEKELPAGSHLAVVMDNSIFIESAVKDTLGNIFLGIILTAFALLFFLHDYRSTLIAAITMPMSIISTFLLMQLAGFTLNLLSLMGLSISVGIIVDNSVVVLENIFRHKDAGSSQKVAASRGTAEIAVVVLAASLTNVVVFLPIANMSSIIGLFFKEFALTIVFATFFSLLLSFTLTPMMASRILSKTGQKKHPIGEKLETMFHIWERYYQRLLGAVLKNKKRSWLVVMISILFIIGSFILATQIGFEFIPLLDEGDIKIEVELPIGYHLDETAELIREIENRLQKQKAVKHILTTIGKLRKRDIGPNMAMMKVKLVAASERTLTTNEIANQFIRELADIPNAHLRVSPITSFTVAQQNEPISLHLLGQDSDTLELYQNKIMNQIKDIQGLVNLSTSFQPGKPEIVLIPNRKNLVNAGVTVAELALTLRSALTGIVTTRFRENGEEYDIRVAMTDESINTPEKVSNLAVVTPTGNYRLAQLADIQFTERTNQILHKDKYKMLELTAGTAPGYALGDITNEIDRRIKKIPLPAGYKITWGGMAEQMQKTVIDMLGTFILAFILTYMLLAAILESLTQPLLILGTVPLALVGVFLGLILTGLSMNAISMMAIVMVLGIVVNNAILLLDHANKLVRKEGKDVRSALLEAGKIKLKPIFLATSTTILGILPMALGLGAAGKEFRQPMGVVSIGGLVVSTILALLVIPTLYFLTARRRDNG